MRNINRVRAGWQAVGLIMVLIMVSSVFMTGFANQRAGITYSSALNINNATGEVDNLFNDYLKSSEEHSFLTANDLVDVIVVLEGESLIDTFNRSGDARATGSVGAYSASAMGKWQEAQLLNRQGILLDEFSVEYGLQPRYSFTTLTNGFSGLMKYGEIKALRQNKNVKSVIVSELYARPTATDGIEVIDNPVNADPYTGIYKSENLTASDGTPIDGEGMLVAILDTGFDFNHDVFKSSPTNPVLTKSGVDALVPSTAAAYLNYIAGGFSPLSVSDVYMNDKIPFAFNYADYKPNVQTSESHGTHVAGIVAGNPLGESKEIVGAAPNAQLALLQVFGADGSAAMTSTLLFALTDAVLLNADVVNMSLGMAMGFSEDEDNTVNEIYNNVTKAGISLVIAAGNDFSSGYDPSKNGNNLTSNPDSGALGMPATYSSSLAVGSISGIKSQYLLANGTTPVYINESVDSFFEKRSFVNEILNGGTEKTFNYVKVPGIGSAIDYVNIQNAFAGGNTIAVVKRGQITFEEKAAYAQNFGAVACIIYNNVSGPVGMQIDNSNGVTIPVGSISVDIGEKLPQSGDMKVSRELTSGPFISDYSSWGVLPDLTLKPEITAHGGEVYSSVPGNKYGRLSGTSMAAPNASGAVALLRQFLQKEHPDLSKLEIYDLVNRIIMSTATIAKNEEGNPYSPRKQGAGLADVYNGVATDAYLYVEGQSMTKLSIGDDKNKTGRYELTFNIQNMSNTAKSYRVAPLTMTEKLSSDGKTVAEIAKMLSPSMSLKANGNVRVNGSDSVSVAGLGSGSITVTLTLNGNDKNYIDSSFENGMFVEGYVRLLPFASSDEGDTGVSLSIPWTGFYGDWTKAPMLDATAYDIARSNADSSILDKDKLKEAVYASIPTAYFYAGTSAYEFGLGEFSYTLKNEALKPAVSEDKAALSESEDGHFGIAGVTAGMIRSAKAMDVSISNSLTGHTVYNETLSHITKSYYSSSRIPGYIPLDLTVGAGEFTKPVPDTRLGLANNTKYNLNLTGHLDYAGEQNNLKNSYSFSFYVDSDAPFLQQEQTKLRIEERNNKKHYYLDMYVFDNHYIEAMMVGTYSKISSGELSDLKFLHEENVIPLNTGRNAVTYVTHDITNYWDLVVKNGEKLIVQFTDYAKNAATYLINIPRVNATGFSFTQDEITIKTNETVDLKNYLVSNPSDAWKFGLNWTAANTAGNILINGGDGEIMGLKATTSPVTVTVSNEEGDKASIKVNVVTDSTLSPPEVNGLKMTYTLDGRAETSSAAVLLRGDTGRISLSAEPWNATPPGEITWSSSAEEYIKVTRTGNAPYMTAKFEVSNAIATSKTPVTVRALVKGTSIYASITFTIEEEFEVEGGVLKFYHGFGDSNGVVEIPGDLGIRSIGYAAFAQNMSIKEVILPDGVTEINALAFALCSNLQRVVLSSNGTVKYIGYMAFNECYKLTSVENFESVEVVHYMSFATCDLRVLNSPGLLFVGEQAFVENKNLVSVDVSKVSYMGANAFTYCESLTGIKTSPITAIGEGAFASTGVMSLVLQARYIGPGAFADCQSLRSVVIATDLKYVGNSAFSRCSNLSTVIFSGNVPVIEGYAFRGCGSLVSIMLPGELETLGDSAFGDCANLAEVTFPKTARLRSIGYSVFGRVDDKGVSSKVTSFIVEDGNPYLSIGEGTTDAGYLYNGTKTKLILATPDDKGDTYTAPSTLTEVGMYSLSGHKYVKIVSLPWNANTKPRVKISDGAFYGSSVEMLDGNSANSIYYIGYAAFAMSGIEEYKTTGESNKLEYIGVGAFYECGSLTQFIADFSALEFMGAQAFYNCTALEYFTSLGVDGYSTPNIGVLDLSTATLLEEISDSAFAYTGFYKIILPQGAERIGINTFASMSELTDVDFSFTVKIIDMGAFMGCDKLSSITVSESVTHINQSAFNGCRELVDLNTAYENGAVKKGLTEVAFLGWQAFYLCPLKTFTATKVIETEGALFALPSSISNLGFNTTLVSVDMPRLKIIGQGTFAGCYALSSINIPNVQIIGDMAFEECISLTYLSVPLVREIGFYAFFNCISLGYADISAAQIIAPYAFAYTSSLSAVKLERIEYIASAVFMNSSLSKLYLPDTLLYLDESAFVLMPNLSSIEVSPLNKSFFSEDGVLYSWLPNGGYQLECYPMLKLGTSYVILEGTVRIAENAFLGNSFLNKVTFPWSLKAIGDAAFFGCSNLIVYKFLSYEAPILESHFIAYYYLMSYMNFGEFIGDGIIVMERPDNGLGYDHIVMESYFASVVDGGYTLDYITKAAVNAIALISDTVTLENKAQIEIARAAFNGIKSEEQRRLVANYDKLVAAETALEQLLNPARNDNTLIIILVVICALIVISAICFVIIKSRRRKA